MRINVPACLAGLILIGAFAGCLCPRNAAGAQTASITIPPSPPYLLDQILVKPKPGVSLSALAGFHSVQGTVVLQTFQGIGGIEVLRLPPGGSVPDFVARYEQSGLVEFAEPDYEAHTFTTSPNDPKFTDGTLWGLNNFGQNGGTPHADIDAPDAWDIRTSASNIVVAVLDTGVWYTHEDLASNMWVNPHDGNHGTNALPGAIDLTGNDDSGHGTMIAGVLGALGNNGKGVAGVAWQVQIMACKCFNNFGVGNSSAILACLAYAQTNGAQIINASWGGNNSLALSNAVASTRDAGIIFVQACGNSGTNIDVAPVYPASWHFDNVVAVAWTTRNDTLASLSNYGATTVHLAAPGDNIYSTFAGSNNGYLTNSGTSFSAPYVTGALALVMARYPTETYQQIIARVLNGVDPLPALAGKCVTGGRLNLRKALSPPISLTSLPSAGGGAFAMRVSGGANRTCVVQVSTNLAAWFPVFTNTTSADGTFDFADNQSTNSTRRFYRAVSTP